MCRAYLGGSTSFFSTCLAAQGTWNFFLLFVFRCEGGEREGEREKKIYISDPLKQKFSFGLHATESYYDIIQLRTD